MPTPSTAPVMTDAALSMVADWFRVLSEPSRLKILHALQAGEKNISELVEATGLTQTNVSRHVQSLVGARMVERRREGLATLCRITDEAILELCENVCNRLHARMKAEISAMQGEQD